MSDWKESRDEQFGYGIDKPEPTLQEMLSRLPWFGRWIVNVLGGVLFLAVLFCAAFLGIEAWEAIKWALGW
jgi:hypothetical protein